MSFKCDFFCENIGLKNILQYPKYFLSKLFFSSVVEFTLKMQQ